MENLKAHLKGNVANESQGQSKPNVLDEGASNAVNLMQHANSAGSSWNVEIKVDVVPGEDEGTCNEEELNLNVTQPIFSK